MKIKRCISTMLAVTALAICGDPRKGQNEYEQGVRMEEAASEMRFERIELCRPTRRGQAGA